MGVVNDHLVIAVSPNRYIEVQLPASPGNLLTEAEWAQMMVVLEAMRPALVRTDIEVMRASLKQAASA